MKSETPLGGGARGTVGQTEQDSTRPADNPAPYTRRHVTSCIHGRPRFCQPCLGRRRRVAFLLDELLADLYPAGWDR